MASRLASSLSAQHACLDAFVADDVFAVVEVVGGPAPELLCRCWCSAGALSSIRSSTGMPSHSSSARTPSSMLHRLPTVCTAVDTMHADGAVSSPPRARSSSRRESSVLRTEQSLSITPPCTYLRFCAALQMHCLFMALSSSSVTGDWCSPGIRIRSKNFRRRVLCARRSSRSADDFRSVHGVCYAPGEELPVLFR